MSTNSAPSLFAGGTPGGSALNNGVQSIEAKSLLDLMLDGFYMIFLMKNKYSVSDAETFRAKVRDFLGEVDRGGRKINASADDVYLAKYAYCALVDEVILNSQVQIRENWARRPLQLELFGDQLAGETFFERLEELRRQGAAKVGVLEVFHLCLLLGFQGKYFIEGPEKLGYLTARVGDEIATHKGQRASFAPFWQPTETIKNKLRNDVPLWVIGSVFALAGILAFIGIRWTLTHQTQKDLAGLTHLISMPAQTANILITLP